MSFNSRPLANAYAELLTTVRLTACTDPPKSFLAWVQKNNWSSAHTESRGRKGGKPRVGMSCSSVDSWYPFRSLPWVAHVNLGTIWAARLGVGEMGLKDPVTLRHWDKWHWDKAGFEKEIARTAIINVYLHSHSIAICESATSQTGSALSKKLHHGKITLCLHFEPVFKHI